MRERLSRTWKALTGRLTDADFPAHVVFETLAEVATEGMVERYGCSAASHMLRLRADALETLERDRLAALLRGDEAEVEPAYPPLMPLMGRGELSPPRPSRRPPP